MCRTAFENLSKYGASVIARDSRSGTHMQVRQIRWLSRSSGHLDRKYDLNSREKEMYIRGCNETVMEFESINNAQNALLQGYGYSLIALALTSIGFVRSMDVNGTAPSLNSLGITFTTASLVQSVRYVFNMVYSLSKNRTSTLAVCVLNDIDENSVRKLVKSVKMSLFNNEGFSKDSESKMEMNDMLDENYYENYGILYAKDRTSLPFAAGARISTQGDVSPASHTIANS